MQGELILSPVNIPIPSDPTYKQVIDDLLRALGVDPDAPASFSVYVLRKYPNVAVQLGALHGLRLVPTGTGSYRLT
jgi:hypothetical protein